MTAFQILVSNEGGHWHEASRVEAHSASAAVTKAYLKNPTNILAIVAVPVRSWKPTAIRLEQKPKVILGSPVGEQKEPNE